MSGTPKRRQSLLAIVSIGLTLVAFILFVVATFVSQFAAYSTYIMFVGLGLLIFSWGIYFLGGRAMKSPQDQKENVMTVIGCRNCDYREERPFAPGDFIPKELGPCKKCSGPSYIKAIYSIETKKE